MRKTLIVTTMLMASNAMAHTDQMNPQPGKKVNELGDILQTVDSSANNAWYSLVERTEASDSGSTRSKLYVVKHNFADRVNADPYGQTHFELEKSIYVDDEYYDNLLNAQSFEDGRGVTTTQLNTFDNEIVINSRKGNDLAEHNSLENVVFDTSSLNLSDLHYNGKTGSFELIGTQYQGKAKFFINDGSNHYSEHGLFTTMSQIDTSFDQGIFVSMGLSGHRYRIEGIPLIQDTDITQHPKFIYTSKNAYATTKHVNEHAYGNDYLLEAFFPLNSNVTVGYKCSINANLIHKDEVITKGDWVCKRY